MTSRPDSTPATPRKSQYEPIDYDVVATQGAYLIPCMRTPIFEPAYDEKFAATLKMELDALIYGQELRRAMYHDAADEWPMGHTPQEVIDKRQAELDLWDELAGVTSDESSDNDDDDNKNKDKSGSGIVARVSPGKPVAAPDRPRRPRQADRLPSPPLSAESPLATPHGRKRRRIYKEEDEEKEYPAQEDASFSQEVPAAVTAQQKDRKRRRTLDVCDDEEVDKERPSKMRIITTRPSNMWLQRLRPRPRRPAD